MTPKQRIKHGNEFPFDAPDCWWQDRTNCDYNTEPKDWAHATARGIVEDLQDRRGFARP